MRRWGFPALVAVVLVIVLGSRAGRVEDPPPPTPTPVTVVQVSIPVQLKAHEQFEMLCDNGASQHGPFTVGQHDLDGGLAALYLEGKSGYSYGRFVATYTDAIYAAANSRVIAVATLEEPMRGAMIMGINGCVARRL